MSDLIIAVFDSQNAAFAAGEALAALQATSGTEPEDIVVVTRNALGRVSVNQSIDRATGQPLGGGRWGALLGMMFLNPQTDGAADAGPAGQFQATGLDAGFLQDVAHALDQGGAAVALRVRDLGVERVRQHLTQATGRPRILQARLGARTDEALSALLGRIPTHAWGQAAREGGF